MDEFENRVSKAPNKYPKICLEHHLKLDDIMSHKIDMRMKHHTENQKNFLINKNPNLLCKSFKSVAKMMESQG